MPIDQLVVTFQRETEELLSALEEGLLELESTDDAASCVDRLFRVAHTLKGNAGMIGFTEFVRLTHVLENVLDRLRSRTLNVNPALIETLFHAFDALKATAETFANGDPFENTPAYEHALNDLFALCDAEEISATEATLRDMEVEVYFRPEFWSTGDDLTTFLDELGMLGELLRVETLFDRVPPLAELVPDQCCLGLRVLLRTTSGQMGVMGVCFLSVDEENIKIREFTAAHQSGADAPAEEHEPEAKAEAPVVAEVAAPQREQTKTKAKANTRASTIRVDADKLDRLMDLVGELVIGISQVQDRSRSQAAVERLDALGRELQDQVMSLRMLPIHDTFERFRRPMRDLAKELGRELDFVISGGTTQVDKKVLESLVDPLKHMLRNCVSHGLEGPEERVAAGKASCGRIHLSAAQREGHVLIEISDDGRGIDTARVLAKAEERGLVSRGQSLSQREIYDLLFQPGFSTASALSEISGRGVGLDVVQRAVQSLRGSIDVESRLGHGTTFRIRLPLTLAIVDGMNVLVGNETVTIPLLSVVELISSGPRTIKTIEGKNEYVDLRGELLPVLRLTEALALNGTDERPRDPHVVVVETERRKFGLLVDNVLGMAQTVIKPLDRAYDLFGHMKHDFVKPRSVNGAAILGDGNVGIILDVHGLETAAFGTS
jgi:two-component system chemotaxis sensor kinase CheA